MEQRTVRWGILGAGAILDRWMKGARQVDSMELVAIASRTEASAQRMAKKHGIPEVLSIDALLSREDIDTVYVAAPHTAHKELAIRAMRAGKAVLVEKPAGVNAGELQEMLDCARETGVFFMEAMWMRCFPMMDVLRRVIAEGRIGELRMIRSANAFRAPDDGGRLYDPMRAGGGLLDVGIYCLHFNAAILGKEPLSIHGTASMDTDALHLQVDEQAAYIAQYDRGELAVMISGVRTEVPNEAEIYGTKGSIFIACMTKPTRITVRTDGGAEDIAIPVPQKLPGVEDEGYQYEVAHVNDCLRRGLRESPVVRWQDSMNALKLCDALRSEWGLKYPFE